jgi:hypothetical protein
MNKRYPFPEIVSGEGGWKVFEDTDRPRTSNLSKEMYVPVGNKCMLCGYYHDKQIRRHELGHVKWSPKTMGKLGEDESEVAVEVVEEARIGFLLAQKGMGIKDWVMCPDKAKDLALQVIYTASQFQIICYLLASTWKVEEFSSTWYKRDEPDNPEYLQFLDLYDELKPILTRLRIDQIDWCISKYKKFYNRLVRKGKSSTASYNYKPSYRKTRVVAKELNLLRDDFSERPEPEEVLEKERQKKLAQKAKSNSFANMSESKPRCSDKDCEDPECDGDDYNSHKQDTLEASLQRTKQELADRIQRAGSRGKINYSNADGYKGRWGNMDIIEGPREVNLQGQIKQGRKYRPQDYGTNPKYMNRWCVDKKVFKQNQRVYGGTILIDASGSMDFSGEDILEIMQQLPAVTIAMYNHKGFRGASGTLRIIGKNGKRVTQEYLEEHSGGGNLVDGPALRWLANMPPKRIWVSDMYVFGLGNNNEINLLQECQQIMRQNGITRLADIDEVKRFALELNRLQ